VPCANQLRDLRLATLTGGSKRYILAELLPALELALASSSDLTEEEVAITSELSKRLSVLNFTVEEKKSAYLIAARVHLKTVLALAVVPDVHRLSIPPVLTCC
jgi:hypothetical protein